MNHTEYLLFARLLFESSYRFIELSKLIGYYSSAATIQEWLLVEQMRYILQIKVGSLQEY